MAHHYDNDDGYVRQGGRTTDQRRRRRGAILLSALAVLLVVALFVAIAVNRGVFGGSAPAEPSCTPGPTMPAPASISVNVYNATTRPGLAARVAADLKQQGFTVLGTKNDPLGKSLTTEGQVRHGSKGLAQATVLAARFPGAKLVPDERTDTSVDVVLWSTFKQVTVPSTPPKLPGAC